MNRLAVSGLALSAMLWTAGCGVQETPPAVTASVTTQATSEPTPSAAPSAAPAATAVPTPAVLRLGDAGEAVRALQSRLIELGFWLGTPDGHYGDLTFHAVTAFQKVAGLPRDGVTGPATLDSLARAARPSARSLSGNRIEVDLAHQVMLVVANGQTQWIMDVSTGRVAGTTPTGHHAVYRQVDGYHRAPLGVLYRPKYIHEGVAVHGFPSVPPYPASHGCIRVVNPVMDWLWSSGAMPLGTDVWVY
jgi:hypothetical protein